MTTSKEKFSVNVDALIKESIKRDISVNEAYHVQSDVFKLVTDHVSVKVKNAHLALYDAYTKAASEISAKIDAADKRAASPNTGAFRSLKLDEVYNLNASLLHKLYFENCFSPSSEVHMDSLSYIRLQQSFGTFDDWQKDFMACALACGQGWAVCGYHTLLKRIVNTMISNHSQDVMIGLYPIIVLDMHEHAYHRDYLNDKQSYIVSMMREFNWSVIEQRFEVADAVATSL